MPRTACAAVTQRNVLRSVLAGAAWLAASLAMSSPSYADQLPQWELGFGAGIIDFPDYRGADERSTYVLPVPYVIYRGERLRVDRDGLRGLFFKSDRVQLDLSASASIPVKSSDNSARSGMPDLDPTIEIGPTVDVTLFQSAGERVKLKLEVPLRAAFATDFARVRSAGWVFEPHLNLDLHKLTPLQGWRAGASVGPVFADRRNHEYYYGVDPQFATPTRPAYQARGGYSGTQLTLSTSRRFPRFWVGAFARYDWLGGAVFDDSPLMRQQHAFATGVAFAWVFKQSTTLVDSDD